VSEFKQQYKRHTLLRDFGAIQNDISTQDTTNVVAVKVNDHPGVFSTNFKTVPALLRNVGAFPHDISTLATTKVAAVEVSDRQEITSTNIRAFPIQDGLSASPDLSPTEGPTGEAATIIPFSPSVAQFRWQHGYQHQTIATVQKATKKKWINFAIRVGFTIILFLFLFKSLSWPTLLQTLAHANLPLVLIGLTIGAFGLVVSAYQWRSLLHIERIPFDLAKLINLYMVGIAFSHFLPTGMGGDAVKAIYVGRESGNKEGSASAVIMSRVTGFFGMLVIATIVLIIWHDRFTFTIVIWFVMLSLLVGCMIIGAVFSATLLPKLFRGKWARYRIFSSAARIGNALRATAKKPQSLVTATLFGMLFWVIGCLNYYSYALALGIQVPLYFYFVAVPFVSLVTFLPISINGFGVRESAFVYVFSTIHVPVASSLLIALLMDAQVLFFGALGGYIYFTMGSSTKVSKQRHVA
jgi:uncharacterized protein (TIRG00374 family)